ncbi:3-dehydrosphinganine reductase [Allomyces arbusculus]|nr:3-dehydrosphinganine reductase [Allomyces arbusculus]
MLDLKNKHVFITGGSAGLGLAIAKVAVARGAHVCLVARRQGPLDTAVADLKAAAPNAAQQIIAEPADCAVTSDMERAFANAVTRIGLPPFLVVANAGTSVPKGFLDLSPQDFQWQMNVNYMSAVNTSHAGLRAILDGARRAGTSAQGRIALVSSVAGLIGFSGYSAYSPTKAAIISLGQCLRHEVLGGAARNVKIHVFLPGTMDTPGFEQEQKTKPELTKQLEKDDPILSPDECAKHFFNGVDKGHFQITTTFTGELLRCAGRMHAPANNVLDYFKALMALIGLLFWRRTELDPFAEKYPMIPDTRAAFAGTVDDERAPLAEENKDK